jgi:hypothetical protein
MRSMSDEVLELREQMNSNTKTICALEQRICILDKEASQQQELLDNHILERNRWITGNEAARGKIEYLSANVEVLSNTVGNTVQSLQKRVAELQRSANLLQQYLIRLKLERDQVFR